MSPGFTELDEVEDSLVRKQAWRDFLTQGRAAGNLLIQELNEAGLKPKELDKAFDMVAMYAEVDFPPGLESDTQRPETATAWAALDTFWAALKAKLPGPISQDTTCPTQKAARTFLGQLRIDTLRCDRPPFSRVSKTWDFSPKIIQNRGQRCETKRRLRDEIQQLLPISETSHQAFLESGGSTSIGSPSRFSQGASLRHRRAATPQCSELRRFCSSLLRSAARERMTFGRRLQLKYRWLFVDEFRTPTPPQRNHVSVGIQNRRSVNLSCPPCAEREGGRRTVGSERDWRTMPLRPGALFVVGDPKQSIFRFRRADIDIYNTVRARLDDPPVSEVLSLTTNFRSVPALCDFANDVFQRQFPAQATPQSPKFAPLDRHRAGAGGVLRLRPSRIVSRATFHPTKRNASRATFAPR